MTKKTYKPYKKIKFHKNRYLVKEIQYMSVSKRS